MNCPLEISNLSLRLGAGKLFLMKIAALVDDLLFSSKIAEVAKQMGASVVFCKSPGSVPLDVDRIFVDLNATGFDALDAVQWLVLNHRAPITAYLSHVQTELARQAQTAGAGEVLSRSVFVQRLPALLSPEG
jgi:hypothetical protein